MKKTATIYDYVRMCVGQNEKCYECKLFGKARVGYSCTWVLRNYTDKANEIILNWCEEHPIKTRQDGFLEMFPNAEIYTDGVLKIKPCYIDKGVKCDSHADCLVCRDKYWLAEVEE